MLLVMAGLLLGSRVNVIQVQSTLNENTLVLNVIGTNAILSTFNNLFLMKQLTYLTL
jgi:hypothetical protein